MDQVASRQANGRHTFVTYFDSNYATRGTAMLRSLLEHAPDAKIHVLGLDPLVRQILLRQFQERIDIVSLEELFAFDRELEMRRERQLNEFYATLKPVFALYAMHRGAADVTHIDADAYFFSTPEPMFAEIGEASVAVSPHRCTHRIERNNKLVGRFNAGCVYFRNDSTGLRCLSDWRSDCLAWCYDVREPYGRYMNQGYLRNWPERYSGVRILEHPGVNLAYWNIDRHRLALKDGAVTVDGEALIFFHFSGLPPDPDLSNIWRVPDSLGYRQVSISRERVYAPYLAELQTLKKEFLQEFGITGMGSGLPSRSMLHRLVTFGGKTGLMVLFSLQHHILRYTQPG